MHKFIEPIQRLHDQRARLTAKWRDQIARLDDARHQTSGEIYQNTKRFEAVMAEVTRLHYAETWVERWMDYHK
jgi:hypothetical protein